MRCYFTIDPLTNKKVLIPGCYGSIHREDLRDCCCSNEPTSFAGFERQAYNEEVKRLNGIIKGLQSDVKWLHKEHNLLIRIIEKLTKKRHA